jgi:Carbamoyl-phosphate synthase L chain, ATP binding domain
MRILFLAPDTHVYNHGFVQGLRSVGARVFGVGPAPKERVRGEVLAMLDGYVSCNEMFSADALLGAAKGAFGDRFDRVETIDEPLVEPAAVVRERLSLPGLPVATARLCRDKVAMKAFLRERGIPCAASARIESANDALQFIELHGYPVVLKPIAGFGSLQTFAVRDRAQCDEALAALRPSPSSPAAIEEFVEGHEGFFDTITDDAGVRHDFAAHYFPGCLEASRDRSIAPQIAVTNRIEQDGYRELRKMARDVVDALSLRNTATHMEWFFGPKGLKFSEIGARPAGEKIWDMYRFANEFDVYREWALASLGMPQQQQPSRRFATGSVQVRPDRDGRIVRHEGLEQAWAECGRFVYEYEAPKPGTPTKPLDKGWLCNTWFRLRHEDYDTLRGMMTRIGATVRAYAH